MRRRRRPYSGCGLRPWIAPVDCARGTWRRAMRGQPHLGKARVNYAPANPANRSPRLPNPALGYVERAHRHIS